MSGVASNKNLGTEKFRKATIKMLNKILQNEKYEIVRRAKPGQAPSAKYTVKTKRGETVFSIEEVGSKMSLDPLPKSRVLKIDGKDVSSTMTAEELEKLYLTAMETFDTRMNAHIKKNKSKRDEDKIISFLSGFTR